MPLMITSVFNQKVYPSGRPDGTNEGQNNDVDDCWVVATIQAALATAPWAPKPTITEFRAAAGDPDDNKTDGGSPDEVHKGANTIYAVLKPQQIKAWTFSNTLAELKKLRPLSAMVDSSKLPVNYGFKGMHQVVFFHEPNVGLYVANPLAPNGSAPIRIATAAAQAALEGYGNGLCYGEFFPNKATADKLKPAKTYTQSELDKAVLDATDPLKAEVTRLKGLLIICEGNVKAAQAETAAVKAKVKSFAAAL